MRNLTQQEILSIPDLKKANLSSREIAIRFGVSTHTIINWSKRLRIAGYVVPKIKAGRKVVTLPTNPQISQSQTLKSTTGGI